MESYDLEVVDYLVKPVPLERFIKACNRAKEIYELRSSAGQVPSNPVRDHFFVNADYGQVKIKFDDIIWMKGYGDYIKFYLKSTEHPLVVRISFKELDEQLPNDRFTRIHKSYAVAMDAITAIRKNSIFLGEKELSIGETYREKVEKLWKG